jgi:hypothetical protein
MIPGTRSGPTRPRTATTSTSRAGPVRPGRESRGSTSASSPAAACTRTAATAWRPDPAHRRRTQGDRRRPGQDLQQVEVPQHVAPRRRGADPEDVPHAPPRRRHLLPPVPGARPALVPGLRRAAHRAGTGPHTDRRDSSRVQPLGHRIDLRHGCLRKLKGYRWTRVVMITTRDRRRVRGPAQP